MNPNKILTDKNKDNKIDNLDELVKGMRLEPCQFQPTKKNWKKPQERSSQTQKKNIFLIKHWENLQVRKIEWCMCKNCRAES